VVGVAFGQLKGQTESGRVARDKESKQCRSFYRLFRRLFSSTVFIDFSHRLFSSTFLVDFFRRLFRRLFSSTFLSTFLSTFFVHLYSLLPRLKKPYILNLKIVGSIFDSQCITFKHRIIFI
jgi:hypothetical protein